MDVFRASDLRGVRVEEDRGEVGKRYCRLGAPACFVTAFPRPANVTRVTHHVQLHDRYSARHDASCAIKNVTEATSGSIDMAHWLFPTFECEPPRSL